MISRSPLQTVLIAAIVLAGAPAALAQARLEAPSGPLGTGETLELRWVDDQQIGALGYHWSVAENGQRVGAAEGVHLTVDATGRSATLKLDFSWQTRTLKVRALSKLSATAFDCITVEVRPQFGAAALETKETKEESKAEASQACLWATPFSLSSLPHGVRLGSLAWDATSDPASVLIWEGNVLVRLDLEGRRTVLLDGLSCEPQIRRNDQDGLAVTPRGEILIADGPGHRIWRVSPNGKTLALVAGTGAAACNAQADLEQGGYRPQAALEGNLGTPWGIVEDSSGRVLFTDQSHGLVRSISPDGQMHVLAGNGGAGGIHNDMDRLVPACGASLRKPQGLALAADGRILFGTQYGLHALNPDGTIQTLDQGQVLSVSAAADGRLFYSQWQALRSLPAEGGRLTLAATTSSSNGFSVGVHNPIEDGMRGYLGYAFGLAAVPGGVLVAEQGQPWITFVGHHQTDADLASRVNAAVAAGRRKDWGKVKAIRDSLLAYVHHRPTPRLGGVAKAVKPGDLHLPPGLTRKVDACLADSAAVAFRARIALHALDLRIKALHPGTAPELAAGGTPLAARVERKETEGKVESEGC